MLDPDGNGQVAVLKWDTLEERGTIVFCAERQSGEDNDNWNRINNDLLPGLITAPMGGEYLLVDPGAQSRTTYQCRLIELEAIENLREYGLNSCSCPKTVFDSHAAFLSMRKLQPRLVLRLFSTAYHYSPAGPPALTTVQDTHYHKLIGYIEG